MAVFWRFVAIAVLAAETRALPSSQSCLSQYPQAKHIVSLSRSYAPALGNFEGPITIGSQTVNVMLDTGSSDTWFMPQGVQCLDVNTLKPIPDNLCGFKGARLVPDFSLQQIPDANLNVSYSSNNGVIGSVGYDMVSFAGIEIPKQEIGLAQTVAVNYPGNATGIAGLAYPALTNVFAGANSTTDVPCKYNIGANNTGCNQQHFLPLLSTIFANGNVPPVFSFALGRGTANAGVMTVGGIPDVQDLRVNVTKESVEVTVPIEKLNGTNEFTAYLTTIDGFQYAGAPAGASKGQFVVDTGTVPTNINKEDAENISKLFNPPSWYNETLGYLVDCNATAPELSLEIAGQFFEFNPKDLILDRGDGYPHCMTGIQGNAEGAQPILGSVFLRSVLAVFDIGKEQMIFASRMNYAE